MEALKIREDLENGREKVIKLVPPIAIGKTKVKKTKRAYRIWIEGKRLEAAQFSAGEAYRIFYSTENKSIILCANEEGERRVTASRPIIDIHDQTVGKIFNEGDRLEVRYYEHGMIVFRLEEADEN
tara:strand:+ start:452 stop:829 length:378 start_codon:yes stop_codon:yes gene_type:complete